MMSREVGYAVIWTDVDRHDHWDYIAFHDTRALVEKYDQLVAEVGEHNVNILPVADLWSLFQTRQHINELRMEVEQYEPRSISAR